MALRQGWRERPNDLEDTAREVKLYSSRKAGEGSLSRLSDKRPPDIEEEKYPCGDGGRICFPIRFS